MQTADQNQPQNKGRQRKSHFDDLYNVSETEEGNVEVVLPGLLDWENGHIVGITRVQFGTHKEALDAIEECKADTREMFERASLKKTYPNSFHNIEKTEDGKYKATFPGAVDSKTGWYVGTTSKEFDSWQEARDYYLKSLEDKSVLTKNPILELQVSESERVAFSAFDSFSPQVAPSKSPKEIPKSIRKYLLLQDRMAAEDRSASTYQETIKQPNWKKELLAFVSSYLNREGKDLLDELGIRDLDRLSPRQAIELTMRLVIDLTRYNDSDTVEHRGARDDHHLHSDKKTKADKSTVIDLLKDGLANKDNDDWEGNGVCRNFASMTKAVFESLKSNQTMFNRLQDTYCLYVANMDEFAPKRVKRNKTSFDAVGHAWNTFVTIAKTEANATIIDTTWGKRDLDTGKLVKLDQTLTRMEPAVHQIALELSENSPDRKEQLAHILSYYLLKMESQTQIIPYIIPADKLDAKQRAHYLRVAHDNFGKTHNLSQFDDERLIIIAQDFLREVALQESSMAENQFFISRVIALLRKERALPEIPANLLKIIEQEYLILAKDVDIIEIETLWRIKKEYPEFAFKDILVGYLGNLTLSDYHYNAFETSYNDLQIEIFEQIKTKPKFKRFWEESARFRVRMREVKPELFDSFSPGTNEADAKELKQLMNNATSLQAGRYLSPSDMNESKLEEFYARARESLRKKNPELYEKVAAGLDDYEIIKQYNSLYRRLNYKS